MNTSLSIKSQTVYWTPTASARSASLSPEIFVSSSVGSASTVCAVSFLLSSEKTASHVQGTTDPPAGLGHDDAVHAGHGWEGPHQGLRWRWSIVSKIPVLGNQLPFDFLVDLERSGLIRPLVLATWYKSFQENQIYSSVYKVVTLPDKYFVNNII